MHTITWLIWLMAALTAVTLAPHPLYLALVFLAAGLVFAACHSDSPLARSYRLFLQVGAVIFVGYILFSLITIGGMRGTTLLLTLPELRLPDWLGGLVLGGPITAEALAWGATRGLAIWTLLVVFGAFNALVDHYRLLRLTPRSLFHAGLAVTIAVAFVPGLLRASTEIVEAQRARGHRFGGPRSWLPLVAPLLAGSLEKAVQLAEALDARGYGRTLHPAGGSLRDAGGGRAGQGSALVSQISVITGLLLLGAGLFGWLYYGAGAALHGAVVALAGGALLLGWSLRRLGRLVNRTTYRRERWRRRDTLAVLAALASVAILATLRLTGHHELVYYPFPTLFAPVFDLRAGVAALLLATPALTGVGAAAEARPPRLARPPRAARPPAAAPAETAGMLERRVGE